ncbi:MAG TPA: alpha/beta hydrolase [Spirochaetota bacterium]|nr:alpha/beta hydrolase [Spirochaetota bacterium]
MRSCQIPFRGTKSLPATLHEPTTPPRALLVLAHGAANTGKETALLVDLAREFVSINLAVVRFDFPFVAEGKKTPNSEPVLVEACLAAIEEARRILPGIPVLVGGKSLGAKIALSSGRTSPAGAVLLGFPLHAPGHTGTGAARYLLDFPRPILLIQGTRDAFANPALLKSVTDPLKHVTLLPIEGGDHSLRAAGGHQSAIEQAVHATDHWLRKKLSL